MVDLKTDANDAKTEWLSLGDACRILEVSDTTLRQWADNGFLRVYRTPGGHRRFSRQDVDSMTSSGGRPPEQPRYDAPEGPALRRIRRRLSQDSVTQQPWYQSVEEEGRVRMRLFGRRLLSLLLQEAGPRRQRQEVLEEANLLGREYGTEMSERTVSLSETIEAFVFFRTLVLDSTGRESWARILEASDRVLLGVTASYQVASDRPIVETTS